MQSRNIPAILFLAALFCSCGKSFLDVAPRDIIPREAYTKDLKACQEQLHGTFLQLSEAYGTYTTVYPEYAADNIKPSTSGASLIDAYAWKMKANDYAANLISPSDVNLNAMVYYFYNVIRNANFVLEKSTAFRQEDPTWADHLAGSALTLRGLCHFILVNLLAQPINFTADGSHPGIVYVTGSDWTKPVNGRTSVAGVYQNIREDLQKAVLLLRPVADSNLVIGKDMANALLSRVNLFAGKYSEALDAAKQVIPKNPLLTVGNGYPDDMFRKLTISGSESYFQLLPGSSIPSGYFGGGFFPGMYYRQAVQFLATRDITEQLQGDATDVRASWVQEVSGDRIITKFPIDVVPNATEPNSSYYQPVIRVSEVVLNAAEAGFHLGQTAIAQSYLNMVRLRARPGAADIHPTGAALFDSIKYERRRELAFEGFRLFDLGRWKMDIIRTDPAILTAARLNYPDNRTVAPIPKLDLKTQGITQNPGY